MLNLLHRGVTERLEGGVRLETELREAPGDQGLARKPFENPSKTMEKPSKMMESPSKTMENLWKMDGKCLEMPSGHDVQRLKLVAPRDDGAQSHPQELVDAGVVLELPFRSSCND